MVYKLSHCDKGFQQLLQFEIGYVDVECLRTSSQQGQRHYNIIIKIVYIKFTLITRFSFKVCKKKMPPLASKFYIFNER